MISYHEAYTAFHQHFGSDVYDCVLFVQLIALAWSHSNTLGRKHKTSIDFM